jgi:hypothetical protein
MINSTTIRGAFFDGLICQKRWATQTKLVKQPKKPHTNKTKAPSDKSDGAVIEERLVNQTVELI